jgi:hypothetical protein
MEISPDGVNTIEDREDSNRANNTYFIGIRALFDSTSKTQGTFSSIL